LRVPFSVRHAVREGRSGFRRIGWFTLSVALGVAVLVGLYGFQRDVADAARAEARSILGGDLRLQSPDAFPEGAEAILDSLAARGALIARGVSLASVVSAPESGAARLLQVNAVDAGFPVVGRPIGDPEDAHARLSAGGGVVADPQVLLQLRVAAGDPVRIGTADLEVFGSVLGLPVDLGLQWAVGPPVFMALEDLGPAGLLSFGSLAQHRAWIALPAGETTSAFVRRHGRELRSLGLSVRTATEEAAALSRGFEELSRFLSLVGLLALLLGGIGVGSAVHVFLRERLPSVAVLRCLGARQGTLFRAYLLQTAVLGAGGAALGVLVGLGVQFALPTLLGAVLPFTPSPTLRPEAIAAGLLLGTWIAVAFSLLSLLGVRGVSPLVALRSSEEAPTPATWGLRGGVWALLFLTVFGLASVQVGDLGVGAVVAASVAGVMGVLAGAGFVIMRGLRSVLPATAPFSLRQGLSGLFRPGNQTVSVVAALGLGAFLLGALLVVESRLRTELSFEVDPDRPSLLLFDIQSDQREGVEALLVAEGISAELIPIVPSRLGEVAGEPVAAILERRRQGPSWMYRRVYRNTYSPPSAPVPDLVEGTWWGADEAEPPAVRVAVAEGVARVSLEAELARDLGVGVGDRLTWDVQGVPVPSVVSSIREVEWESFQPNFFAIFEPGGLEGAPATFIALAAGGAEGAHARIQDALLAGFPNVSFLDVATVQARLEVIVGRIVLALRSVAFFILAGGGLVLFASLLTTRFTRRGESALLKTLGASGRTIRRVLLWEYAALGAIGATAGLGLGAAGGVLLLSWQFGLSGAVPWATLGGLWLVIQLLAVGIGWSVSGPVLRAPAIAVLRDGES